MESTVKFSPYSFSKINTYEMCPKKFELSYIEKIKVFVPNMATERGSFIHNMLENHTKQKETKYKFTLIDDEMEKECISIYEKFRESDWGEYYLNNESIETEAEVEFGMKITDDGLVPCSYYDKLALFRGKIDHLMNDDITISVADWKTGKISRYPAPLQLVMYAVWAFNYYTNIKTVISSFVYVEHVGDDKMVKEYTFTRDMLPSLTKKVIEKITNIEKATNFPKKEGPLCNYCDYRRKMYCTETTGLEFANDMLKYTSKVERELYYFIHPESGQAWIQDYIDEELPPLVEEITADIFYSLHDLGYSEESIDKTIQSKDN